MKFKQKFLEILPILILVNILAVVLFTTNLSNNKLMYLIPLSLFIALIIIIIGVIIDFKKIVNFFSSINKKTWIFLLLILILAFSLRFFIAPDTHKLYFDEDIYMNIAQNIINDGRAILCNRGTPEKCIEGVLNKQPQGLSVFLAIFFFLFGVNENLASFIMILVSTLSVGLLFLLTYLLFNKEKVALLASLVLTLIPIHILWAPTIIAESLFIFFSLLVAISTIMYLKNKSFPTLLMTISLLVFASQTRTESILLTIPIAFLFLREKINYKIITSLLILLILISPLFFQLKNVSGDTWGSTSGNKTGLEYFKKNASDNSMFFFENTRFPVVFTILIIIGFIFLIASREFNKIIFLLIWFLTFFMMYAVFYAGSFNFGVDVRYSNSLYIPLAILAGLGLFTVAKAISKRIKAEKTIIAVLVIVILALSAQFLSFISNIGEQAWDARAVHDFAVEKGKQLDQNCVVFTHVPTVFLVNGNKALQTWFGSNKQVVNDIFAGTDCVLFYEGYWCVNVDRFKNTVCKYMHDNYDLTINEQIDVRNKQFTFYNVNLK